MTTWTSDELNRIASLRVDGTITNKPNNASLPIPRSAKRPILALPVLSRHSLAKGWGGFSCWSYQRLYEKIIARMSRW
jgi:hypothetical protein